jgi:hypothetical protein
VFGANDGGALLLLPLKLHGSERGLPGHHVLNSPPRVPAGFRVLLAIGRTAAQASVSGLGIQKGMGPITKLYWRRLNTQFTTGVSRRTDEPP